MKKLIIAASAFVALNAQAACFVKVPWGDLYINPDNVTNVHVTHGNVVKISFPNHSTTSPVYQTPQDAVTMMDRMVVLFKQCKWQ